MYLRILRVTVTAEALSAYGQAVLAGGFLNGHVGLLEIHSQMANVVAVLAVLQLIAAVLYRLRGGGPTWPIWAGVALAVALTAQLISGIERSLALHVPLGVAIISTTAVLVAWVWSPARRAEMERRASTGAGAGTGTGAGDGSGDRDDDDDDGDDGGGGSGGGGPAGAEQPVRDAKAESAA